MSAKRKKNSVGFGLLFLLAIPFAIFKGIFDATKPTARKWGMKR